MELSTQHTGFVRDKHIYTYIGLVSKCYNMLNYDISGCNLGIKFDIAKAFDMIDWASCFGFYVNFSLLISLLVGLILSCIQHAFLLQ